MRLPQQPRLGTSGLAVDPTVWLHSFGGSGFGFLPGSVMYAAGRALWCHMAYVGTPVQGERVKQRLVKQIAIGEKNWELIWYHI